MDHSNHDNKILRLIRTNQQWLGFVVVALALIYAFFHIFYEPRHIVVDILYGSFFLLLLWGLYHAFHMEKQQAKFISFNNLDGIFAALAVMVTYSIVHFLDVSNVLASSFIGLVGFLFLRKYQVAIYCGSFAGMVSVALFGFEEVVVLALICAFIFILTKPLFFGYGGKLGTIAFMSSLITFSIFDKEYLVVSYDFSLWLLLLTSVVGVALTFYFQHYFHVSAVFASAIFSFIFALLISQLAPYYSSYTVVFYAASFIGMSSQKHLPNVFFVVLAGLILGFFYFLFFEFFHGLGGKLGLMAMMSVIITSGLSSFFKKYKMLKES
ncbi:MAG: hypothetical protein JXB08_03670 [Bacilli bacterium]|nr:hypothetical protein [Bacilli bacterium]MBN2876275.1 hypothetical protein [Bacilli bacterium]